VGVNLWLQSKSSFDEVQAILYVCCQKEYAGLPPTKMIPLLLDKGIWHGNKSSYYRIFRHQNMLSH